MPKPIALDLFCGRGGWTDALMAVGFEVYGFDNVPQPDYKGRFVLADVLKLTADDLRQYGAVFAACSSPCEQFSVHGMKHFHPNPAHPSVGIALFDHARSVLEQMGVPYIMENVRPAERFVGRATNHCGPYYFWGTAVPAIFPPEAYKVSKGINHGSSKAVKGMDAAERKAYHRRHGVYIMALSDSPERKAATALAATIPPPIARAVAEVALSYVA